MSWRCWNRTNKMLHNRITWGLLKLIARFKAKDKLKVSHLFHHSKWIRLPTIKEVVLVNSKWLRKIRLVLLKLILNQRNKAQVLVILRWLNQLHKTSKMNKFNNRNHHLEVSRWIKPNKLNQIKQLHKHHLGHSKWVNKHRTIKWMIKTRSRHPHSATLKWLSSNKLPITNNNH